MYLREAPQPLLSQMPLFNKFCDLESQQGGERGVGINKSGKSKGKNRRKSTVLTRCCCLVSFVIDEVSKEVRKACHSCMKKTATLEVALI